MVMWENMRFYHVTHPLRFSLLLLLLFLEEDSIYLGFQSLHLYQSISLLN